MKKKVISLLSVFFVTMLILAPVVYAASVNVNCYVPGHGGTDWTGPLFVDNNGSAYFDCYSVSIPDTILYCRLRLWAPGEDEPVLTSWIAFTSGSTVHFTWTIPSYGQNVKIEFKTAAVTTSTIHVTGNLSKN